MIREHAPAKINLGLAVTGRLANGYHSLDTLFCTLKVGDTLHLETTTSGIELEMVGSDLPTNQENLVYRAAQAYLQAAKIQSGVRIRLEKRLPIAAGLGGGSSDAAACLRGLERLYPSALELHPLARELGADVPFLLRGGAARARGIGDVLSPVRLPRVHVVLANPKVGISAKEAYQGLNGRFAAPLALEQILAALERQQDPPYSNTLELPVLAAYPIVGKVKAALSSAGLFGVLMSGSGSTCFGLAKDAASAQAAAQKLQLEHPDWWVCASEHHP
ncbi:MAG: 4-(cytidine 5'-diphospho)-2-C-methyl-D-erythritol kinase [Deinococcales bacterium]